MLGFLGLSGIKMAVIAVVVAVVATIIGGLYWQNSNLQAEVRVLNENNGILKTSVATQWATIDAHENAQDLWVETMDRLQERLREVEEKAIAANEEKRRLNDLFNDHDLTKLTLAKPGLIERRINSGTSDVWSVLYDLTAGSANRSFRGEEATGAPAAAEPGTD